MVSKKFIADVKNVDIFLKKQILYKKWKDKFSDTITVFYEDIIPENNYQTILEKIGVHYDNRPISIDEKLHTLDEKEKIITNHKEIQEYLHGTRYV